jgi:anti-sigma-K factor RskA
MDADVHALAGAFVLDALPPREAAEFRTHLAACPACQTEVAELQTTAVQLGVVVAESPPSRVRDAVLNAARHTRQVPPAVPSDDARRSRRIRGSWLAAAAAVIAVAAGAAALTTVLDDPAEPDPIAAVVAAPDADTATTRLRGGGRLTVVSSERLGEAVVLSENLPPAEADQVYQLWLVDPTGEARPAGVLVDAPGAADLVRDVRPDDQLAITREPAGGSDQPTMRPLAVTESL